MDRATQLQERLGVSERPSSSARSYPAPAREEPTLVREEPTLVREEPTLVREEPTLEFRTEFLDEADISATERTLEEPAPDVGAEVAARVRDDELLDDHPRATPPVPTAPPRTSEFDIPNFRRHQIGPAAGIAAIAATIAVIAAGVGSHRFQRPTEPTVETATQHVGKEPVLQPAPEPRSPAAAAAPITPVNVAINARDTLQQAPVATSLDKNSNAVAVTVTVIPAGAVVFRAGQKLGTGTVQVSVDHHAKQRLTALHDGYAPYNFTLDGSRDSVTVRLRRAPRPEAPAPVSDSPFAEPSERASEGSAETPAE